MRVLHLITGLHAGGAEVQVYGHAIRSRHQVEVAALYDVGGVGDQLRAAGIPVHDLAMRSNRDLLAVPRLVRLMRDGKFDAVHVHLYRACVFGRAAAALARVPVVVTTEHSLGTTLMEGRRLTAGVRALYLSTDRLSHATIAVSHAVRDRLVAWGVPARKISVIPNGLDLRRFRFAPELRAGVRAEIGAGDADLVVGTIGRLVPSKGYDRVLPRVRGAARARAPRDRR